MEQPNNPYDQDDEQPVTRPDLAAQEGIGSNTAGRGEGGATDKAGQDEGGATDQAGSSDGGARDQAGRSSPGATTGTAGRGFTNEPNTSVTGASPRRPEKSSDGFSFNPRDVKQRGNMRSVLKAAGSHRKATLAVAGGLTGAASLGVVIFLVLIPLKIESIVTTLENRFMSSADNAVGQESENMLSNYVKQYVLPALTKCSGTSIDKSCNPSFGKTNNPVDALYKGWSQARLETKLATNYGIEFRAVKHGSITKYYMKAPGIPNPNGDDITNFAGDDKDLFQEVSKGGARQAVRDAFASESRWKQIMLRYKVGRLLEAKYGIKRCIIACDKRDALSNFPKQKINAAQIWLTQRVIVPRTQTVGIVIQCLVDPSCDPGKVEPTAPEEPPNSSSSTSVFSSTSTSTTIGSGGGTTGTSTGSGGGTTTSTALSTSSDAELSGAPEDGTDTAIRTNLVQYAQSLGITDSAVIQGMIDDYNKVSEDGYQKYLLGKILGKIGLEDLADGTVDKATIIGWVNKVAGYIVDLKKSGPELKKLDYATNSTADVEVFTTYETYADEIHTGHVDATEVGSFVKSLGPLSTSTSTSVGGTATAEEAPLYNLVINNSTSSTTSKNYRCSDGKPPKGPICPEEKLGGGNATANAITKTLSTPPLSFISDIASAWNSVVGGIFHFVGDIFGSIIEGIPGIKQVISSTSSFISGAAQPFFKLLTDKLVPDAVGVPESGARTEQLMTAGAAVSGDTFAHVGLGAKAVSATVAANIATQQEQQDMQDFSHQSFFARMFSTDTQYSLISRVALDIPFSFQTSTASTLASMLSNPFSAVTHSFASILSGKASADQTTTALAETYTALGETPYAYLSVPGGNVPKYWDEHCSTNAAQAYESDADFNAAPGTPGRIGNWNQMAADNPDPTTGQPMNTSTNPCLLIESSIGSAGGYFDTGLLTPSDVADLNSSSSSGAAPGGGGAAPGSCGGSGKYSALVSSTASFAGTDQGIDFVPSGTGGFDICAPAPGTITLADQTGHHFDRTSGQAEIIEKLDQPPNAPSSSQYIYYAEIIQLGSNIQVGTTVKKGDLIGHSDQSPGIEVGWGKSPTEGFLCPIGYPTPCGTSFGNWVQGL